MLDTVETSNKTIVKAAAWASGAIVVVRIFFLISSIITARLLTPEDFGLIGIAGTVYMMIDTASATGIGSFLIYKQDLTQKERNTAFAINVVLAFVFAFLIWSIGLVVANAYHRPKVYDILLYAGIAFLMSTLSTVPRSLLIKEMKQSLLAVIDVFVNSLNLLLIVTFAFLGFKHLSYVIPLVISQSVCTVLLLYFVRQPFGFDFEKSVIRKIIRYSRSFAPQTLLGDLLYQVDYLIGSAFLSAGMIGFYYFGFEKAFLSTILTRGISEQVFFPIFSSLQQDIESLKAKYFKLCSYSMFVLAPAFFLAIFLAKDLLTFVYGNQWNNSIFTFQCILGYSLLKINYDISVTLFNAVGRTDQNLKHFLTVTPHTLLFFVIGVSQWGVAGLAVAALLAHTISAFLMMLRIRKHFEWSLKKQFIQVINVLLLLGGTFPILLAVKYLMTKMGMHPILMLGNIILIFISLYILGARLLCPEALNGCWRIFRQKLINRLRAPVTVTEV